MTPIAYAVMRHNLRQSGEMTPDHHDFWREVILTLKRAGLSNTQIAKEARVGRSSITRWLTREDKPRDYAGARLIALLANTIGAPWQGLGGK